MDGTKQRETQPCVSEFTAEQMLASFDPYIIMQANLLVHNHSDFTHPMLLYLETDELIQRARIKFWHALQLRHITAHKTYIRLIVHSEFIDMIRRQKTRHQVSLLLEAEKEGQRENHEHTTALLSRDTADPMEIIEQKIAVTTCTNEVVHAVLHLPKRQQQAMICALREQIDDLAELSNAFTAYGVDIETIDWPIDKKEKQLLMASLSIARQKIKKLMKTNL